MKNKKTPPGLTKEEEKLVKDIQDALEYKFDYIRKHMDEARARIKKDSDK